MKAEYSIVSIGTEKSGSRGYMCVSECVDGKRYIVPLNHDISEINDLTSALIVPGDLSIESIALSRFQLIPALAKNYKWREINNALVIGGGALGFATYFELKRNNVQRVEIASRRGELKSKYGNLVEFTKWGDLNYNDYDTFFECTGEKEVIGQLLKMVPNLSVLYLIGTPRYGPDINVLDIHRKNLQIIGAHELNGIHLKKRQECIVEITRYYQNAVTSYSKEIVRVHQYSDDVLDSILRHKYLEPIHVIKK